MNIAHRDIKLENILLDNKMTTENLEPLVKIADFGLSTYLDPMSKGLTQWCGTDPYLAPEMLRLWVNPSSLDAKYKSRECYYDVKVDIWALGVLTFEMLSGGFLPYMHRN
jgi:serine/threonine protein kinase